MHGGLHYGPDYMSRHGQEGVNTARIKEARLYCTQGLVMGMGKEYSSSNIERRLQMALH